ncbi:MAG: bifunctional (p)ppGpp synthetase/guanosine-3',5'-bis(diphosphate) 3'-pyrophosphohydrolase [bacterium]|nr:bifunctional (p)ppGpp synthetase/guanosine-3',5'-bis(diphosphate) 3'-pyrophosphohydrolase [bacterium]
MMNGELNGQDRSEAARAQLADLVMRARKLSPRMDPALIEQAFWTARQAHEGQLRRSGEPYFNHALDVALTCAELNLGTNAIAAALLHDVVEDTAVSLEIIRQDFNRTVAALVDGVTKISHLRFESEERTQATNFRKLLLHMSKDIRILLIKLADRLHNMNTLEYMPREKQIRIARETLDIYAPLANRLGIGRIKWRLEDLCFKYLEQESYAEVARSLGMRRTERDDFIKNMRSQIQTAMSSNGVECTVYGRAKHIYSVFHKMQDQQLDADEIFDLLAFRIITDSVADCYHVLGVIHTLFKPLPQRFKDYIATPKRNGYQSLHSVVIADEGTVFEVQIRTLRMHEIAELGVAAHWRYKDIQDSDRTLENEQSGRELNFLRNFLEELKEGEWSDDPSEFMAHLKIELFQDGIFVFTPNGDLHSLPIGATALDFAYAIHTEVGDRCAGARVDNRIVPLRRELQSGDVVEIITRKDAHPSRDWLNVVKTSKAAARIKRRLRERELEQSLTLGRELLEREFRKHHESAPGNEALEAVAESLGVESLERVIEGVGRGNISAAQVFNRMHPTEVEVPFTLIEEGIPQATAPGVTDRGVRVEGHGNMMIRFAGCCRPLPGDAIVGVVTRGRGISIHRSDCVNVIGNELLEERLVSVEWDAGEMERFRARLLVSAGDRGNLLADITGQISKTGTNIVAGSFERDEKELMHRFYFTLELKDLSQLDLVIRNVRKVRGVQDVRRG